jgi:hypothetical protein
MIEQCICNTGLGKFNRKESIFSCLTDAEFEELNTIGYSGKTSAGKKLQESSTLTLSEKGSGVSSR